MTSNDPDFNAILHANLERVFSERDAAKRALALAELYVDEPTLYEPAATVVGQRAIGDVVEKLLAQFAPDFTFVADGVAVGHHGLACLRWHAGPKGGPVVVTGADVAEFIDGKIARLWVLLDAPA